MTEKKELLAKARVVFGSRLAGPAERADVKRAESTLIAGVLVPPKPAEPDNCCMSGCVNCVWDLYRDDMEEWAAKAAEARVRLQAEQHAGQPSAKTTRPIGSPSLAMSMDDDGGGSETNWDSGASEDLFGGIPVGIREFMKTEKLLKARHSRTEEAQVT
jgi:hypothetical protein